MTYDAVKKKQFSQDNDDIFPKGQANKLTNRLIAFKFKRLKTFSVCSLKAINPLIRKLACSFVKMSSSLRAGRVHVDAEPELALHSGLHAGEHGIGPRATFECGRVALKLHLGCTGIARRLRWRWLRRRRRRRRQTCRSWTCARIWTRSRGRRSFGSRIRSRILPKVQLHRKVHPELQERSGEQNSSGGGEARPRPADPATAPTWPRSASSAFAKMQFRSLCAVFSRRKLLHFQLALVIPTTRMAHLEDPDSVKGS